MNQPIGIPSGWEEIAALFAAPPFIGYQIEGPWREAKSSARLYEESTHDWRVED